MRTTTRMAAACAAATLSILTATSAYGDDLDNGIDVGIDTTHEVMTLLYDDTNMIAGASGPTTVTMLASDLDGHTGCNLPGNVSVTLTPHYSVAGIVDVQLANGGVVQSCSSDLIVTVVPTAVGSTVVTFTGVISTGAASALNSFTYSGASFEVTVNRADLSTGGGSGTSCDVDPAAPAWAAAILQASGVKATTGDYKNAVASTAKTMDSTASFRGVMKDGQFTDAGASYEYANAVQAYLVGLLPNKNLVSAQVAKRPGWSCTSS
jgi:hypothetical protein